MKKTFLEVMMGSPTSTNSVSATSFRPSEAEKLVLLNIDTMISGGRKVTQQDAINVSQEEMDEQEISKDQLESAYKQLINVQILSVEPDQTVVISQQGQPVIEELKKAKEQEDSEKPADQPPGGDMGMQPPGAMPGAENMGAPTDGGPSLPMEGIELIRYLNDMSKLLG